MDLLKILTWFSGIAFIYFGWGCFYSKFIILEFIHIKNIIFESLIQILEENEYKLFSINENLLCYPEDAVKYIKFI